MNKLSNSVKSNACLVLLFFFAIGISCSPSIALYDQFAYTQATSLKVDLQNLADESSSVTFSDAKQDIDKMNTQLEKDYEYAKGLSKNSITTAQYEILRSDNGFYKTFLKTWKLKGKLNETEAGEISIKIGQLVDKIIELENGKNKKK